MTVQGADYYYDIGKNEVIADPDSKIKDFSDNSNLDVMTGQVATILEEAEVSIQQEMNKLFMDLAEGDDLDAWIYDRYKKTRLDAAAYSLTLALSRPNADAGDEGITTDMEWATDPDTFGKVLTYKPDQTYTMTGTSLDITLVCTESGEDGQVAAYDEPTRTGLVNGPSLNDATITWDHDAAAGGRNRENDEEFRERVRNENASAAGAAMEKLEQRALTVTGVESANGFEQEMWVKQYDPATDTTVGVAFNYLRPILYIADDTGTASQNLIDDVKESLLETRAGGIKLEVFGATKVDMIVSVSITWKAGYDTQANADRVEQWIVDYINAFNIGDDFSRDDFIDSLKDSFTTEVAGVDVITPIGSVATEVYQILKTTSDDVTVS